MLLISQWFGETICWHFRGGYLRGGDPFYLHLLPKPAVIDVNIL